MIDHLFDVDCDNAHMVKVDAYEAHMPMSVLSIAPASVPQLNYLKLLFAERKNNEEAKILRTHLLGEYNAGRLSKQMASEAIEDVKAIPKDTFCSVRSGETVVQASHGEVWLTADGRIVRVKESQSSGNCYGMVWNGRTWDYTPGIMNYLDHQMTADEAQAFGHEHQWCVFCSLPLSDPRSEYAGYGPTCARKRDLPWGSTYGEDEPDAQARADADDAVELTYSLTNESVCYTCGIVRPLVMDDYIKGCHC